MPELDIIGESKPSLSTGASTCAMISVIERGGGESAVSRPASPST
jgi:hypothetical protein